MLHAPLPRLLGPHFRKAHTPLRLVIDIRERDLRDKVLGLPRLADDTVEFVDLFEGQTLGLVDHEEAKNRVSGSCGRGMKGNLTYTKAMQMKQNVPQTKKTLL